MEKNYKLKGVDCALCATEIESDLADLGFAAKCSYAKEELRVRLVSEKKDLEIIRKTLEKHNVILLQ